MPEIIAFFWITKVATTAMGETTSDCLNGVLGPPIAYRYFGMNEVLAFMDVRPGDRDGVVVPVPPAEA